MIVQGMTTEMKRGPSVPVQESRELLEYLRSAVRDGEEIERIAVEAA
jgi:hypothetical protein